MNPAPDKQQQTLAAGVRAYLAREYPDATCALRFTTPHE
jgi:hypothetical protein